MSTLWPGTQSAPGITILPPRPKAQLSEGGNAGVPRVLRSALYLQHTLGRADWHWHAGSEVGAGGQVRRGNWGPAGILFIPQWLLFMATDSLAFLLLPFPPPSSHGQNKGPDGSGFS